MVHKPVLVCLPIALCTDEAAVHETLDAALEPFGPTGEDRWDEWMIGGKHHPLLPLLSRRPEEELHIRACPVGGCPASPHPGLVDAAPATAIDWDALASHTHFGRVELLDTDLAWHPRPLLPVANRERHPAVIAHEAHLLRVLTAMGAETFIAAITCYQ